MKVLIAILAVITLASAQETFDRPCRTAEQLEVKSGFTPPAYLGLWYEIERYEQRFQLDADCVTAVYSLNADGSINVLNRALNKENQTFLEDIGRAVISFPDEDPLRAMLNVTFGTTNCKNN
jgi:apolipoprotein D and lipocalin family protein